MHKHFLNICSFLRLFLHLLSSAAELYTHIVKLIVLNDEQETIGQLAVKCECSLSSFNFTVLKVY